MFSINLRYERRRLWEKKRVLVGLAVLLLIIERIIYCTASPYLPGFHSLDTHLLRVFYSRTRKYKKKKTSRKLPPGYRNLAQQ